MERTFDFTSFERVATNDDCRKILANLRWADGFYCPECQNTKGYVLNDRPLIECAKCKRQTSPTAGTILHGMRMLVPFFHGIANICRGRHASAASFSREEKLHYSSAWKQLHKLRTILEVEFLKDDCIEFPCSLLSMALFKPSNEPPHESSVLRQPNQDRIVSITMMPANDESTEQLPPDLAKAIVAFLLSIYRGVSRKYAQKYLAEFSWIITKRHIDALALLSICIRGQPLPFHSIANYRSPFLVRLVRTNSINFPLICAI